MKTQGEQREHSSQAPGAGAAFDAAARSYDLGAASNPTMRWLQRESIRALVSSFPPAWRVLEVGCGTGVEAVALASRGVSVVATDASAEMVRRTSARASKAGLGPKGLSAFVLPVEKISDLQPKAKDELFDGAYSSLGPLNCTADISRTARDLALLVKPGGFLVVSLLNKYCLWETVWYLFHADARRAFRRWGGRAPGTSVAGGATFDVYYWTLGELRAAFAPYFRERSLRAFAWALPPTYLAGGLVSRPRLLRLLTHVERATGDRWPFYHLGDHVHFTFERR